MFVHHVLFWLKKDLSADQVAYFETELKKLSGIESLVHCYIGTPAATDRPVVDTTYSYSLMTVFKDKAGHDVYQDHALHQAFLNNCRTLWAKVVIYDAD